MATVWQNFAGLLRCEELPKFECVDVNVELNVEVGAEHTVQKNRPV